jgi:hypothetical protein
MNTERCNVSSSDFELTASASTNRRNRLLPCWVTLKHQNSVAVNVATRLAGGSSE